MEQVLIILFSDWTYVLQLDLFFFKSNENKATRDCHAVIVVVEGCLRHVHSSTPKRSLEACVEPFPAEVFVT